MKNWNDLNQTRPEFGVEVEVDFGHSTGFAKLIEKIESAAGIIWRWRFNDGRVLPANVKRWKNK